MSIIQGNSIESGVSTYQIERSLRFNSADSAYLSRTLSTSGNRRTWTWSGWVKGFTTGNALFGAAGSSGGQGAFYFSNSSFVVYEYSVEVGAETFNVKTTAVYRDPSAWYHFVVAFDTTQSTASNRIKVYVNGVQVTSFITANYPSLNFEGYNINNSAKRALIGTENYSGSGTMNGYLTEINFIDGQALDPTSFGEYNSETGVWQPIEYTGTYGTNGFYLNFSDNSGTTNATLGKDYSSNADVLLDNSVFTATAPLGGTANNLKDNDTSTTLTTSSTPTTGQVIGHYDCGSAQTVKGVRVANYTQANSASVSFKVQYSTDNSSWSDFGSSQSVNPGNVAKVYDIIATQQSARYWRLIANQNHDAAVTVGDFILATQLGNNWTPNGFSVTAGAGNDSLVDTPTNYGTDTGAGGEVRGNYATLNPLDQVNSTFSNGNLDVIVGTGGGSLAFGNFPMTTGKWYWEIVPTSSTNSMIGIADAYQAIGTRNFVSANGWYYYSNGQKYNNLVGTAYGASYTTNDVIGVAYDADNGSVVFYKNGTSQGTAFTGLTGKGIIPALNNGSSSTTEPYVANFGQRPFAYTAPSGFKALCTQNLPEPTVVDGGEYFQAVPYQGNSSTQTISGVGFQPDFTWLKGRSYAGPHKLFDAVRGATKSLSSNLTDAEVTDSDALTAFTSDGFSLGADGDVNRSADGGSHISWNWKAGGTGVSNTAGTITSTVSANPTAGFSIVTYTGSGTGSDTIGHGLGAAPSWVIAKNRSNTDNWIVYFAISGTKYYAQLNLTNAASSTTGYTSPTSTVFNPFISLGSGDNYVAYCFAPVEGYSAFGSYTGNGSSTDGPFIYTGFNARYILIKASSIAGEDWCIQDTVRDPYNPATKLLFAQSSAAEATAATNNVVDTLSNGFKVRTTSGRANSNGATYIYAAFAENPFKYSLAR